MPTLGTDLIGLSIAPPLVLIIGACVLLMLALSFKNSRLQALLALVTVAIALVYNFSLYNKASNAVLSSFAGRYISDVPSVAFGFIILLGTALAILVSYDYLQKAGLDHPEYYPLMLLSASGAMMMASANDLIILVLALEIMSLAVYVLAAWRQDDGSSEEAGMKYFLLGAFASAFLIYGIALNYGATGQFSYGAILASLSAEGFSQGMLASIAGLFILVGLAFKVALAPFHQWAPDVYTGAPTSVTAYMSVVVKTAAFAALVRFASLAFPYLNPVLYQSLAILIAITLVVANFSALMQRSLKRMLAYSAVAHAGYLAMAVLNPSEVGSNAILWYMMAYTFMNVGAFAVLSLISRSDDRGDDLSNLAGLGRHKPYLAFSLSIFLLGLAGIPPFAGFFGKIQVFQAAIDAGYIWLAILGILTSVLAVLYYVRPIIAMFTQDIELTPLNIKSGAAQVVILLAVVATIALGLFPGWWSGVYELGNQVIAGI